MKIPRLITDRQANLDGTKKPHKRHKYAVSAKEDRTVDGIVFDSKAEMHRYLELRLLESAKAISDLKMQVPFKWKCTCSANDRECNSLARNHYETYLADFSYETDGKVVYEDSKGFRTPEFKRKKRIVEALFDVEIVEV